MVEAADLDGDGELDIVAIDESRGVAVYFGQKDRGFSPAFEVAGGQGDALRAGGNGPERRRPDRHRRRARRGPVDDLLQRRLGSPLRPGPVRRCEGTVYGFAVADLDQDGFLDIAVARSDAPNVVCTSAVLCKANDRTTTPGRSPDARRIAERLSGRAARWLLVRRSGASLDWLAWCEHARASDEIVVTTNIRRLS
jgi:hypothetical protein